MLSIRFVKPVVRRVRHFHYDNRWDFNHDVPHIIHNAWVKPIAGTPLFRVQSKLKQVRHELLDWAKAGTSNSARLIRETRKALDSARDAGGVNWTLIGRLEAQLTEAYRQEELYWQQKSRVSWLHGGDANTRFFHLATMQRRRSNIIARLRDEHGVVHSDEQQKGEVSLSYFQNIFTSNGRDSLEFVRNLNIPTLISSDKNVLLTAQITRAEIKQVFFGIGKYQAPGSDGFTGSFFQRFWDEIGADVSEAILSFFSTGRLLHSINHTWLVLIPKVVNADSMQQLRPIGLCQVMYKAISKILSNRLSAILPHIISPFQNGFIKGRCISDNILIGQEVMQFLKTKVRGQDKWMALKLDMEKAYDRVEWEFLFHIMESMGFCTQWMKWIKACVTTVRFSVLLNGNEYGYFQPQRGIRQGDPLSPLLFAIYTEAFAAMISQAVSISTLHDLKVHMSAPPLSHLFYADDSYLFLRASVPECANLLHLLAEYERYSGQWINLHKSAMCGSANVSEQELLSLSSFLGVATMSPDDKYLGLPSQLRRSKSLTFQFIEEDLAARIRSWKTKALSLAAKEVVIKSIGAAGPIYAMSAFRLPQETC
ncbi:unnamed protein product [Linum trigynum]|uniref:Reverse transcriptase domain-containing protein n=1 Tax=Linum trigynum TaxID=586398 RepID=A0AAV2FP35_9ROSI